MFKDFGLVRRLLPYLRPRRRAAASVVSLTAVSAVLALAAPWPLALLIDGVLGDRPLPGWLGFVAGDGTTGRIVATVGLGIVLVAVQSGVAVLKQWVETRLELGMVLDFRSDIFRHIQRLSWQYHDQGMAGRFIYQTNYIAHEAGSVVTTFVPLGEALVTLVGMFVITYRLGPGLALASLVVLPFLAYAMRFYGRRIEPELLKVRELEGDSMAIVHEKLSIIKVVNSFARERYEHDRFRAQAQLGLDQRVRVTVQQTLFSLGVAMIMAIGTGVVLVVGARSVVAGELSVGQLLVVVAYLAAVYQPLQTISGTVAGLQQQLLQLRVVFDVLDTAIDVDDRPGARPLDEVRGRIEFRGASFTYNGRASTLTDIDLVIEPGTRLAVVGTTGAGKSTLASLVPRYYDVSDGAVLIDGVDVRDLPVEWLRTQVAVVMQDPLLFAGTIAENIQYGRLDATWQELVQATKDAGAHDFVEALPNGYATRIGERGSRLSGGERQRLAIARAFLKNAPILVLDEPTSAVDTATEAGIVEALDRLAAGRTTIVIAHRLSTIRTADLVAVVHEGRIAELGTHDDLLAAGGRYAALWAAQTGQPTSSPARERSQSAPTHTTPPTKVDPMDVNRPNALPPGPAIVPRAELPAVRTRPRVVVLGMMSKMPVGGVVWQTMHYLLGLEQCGCEAWYVEAHARTPSMLMRDEHDDGSALAASFIDATMRRFGLGDRWAFHALHDDGRVHGMTADALQRLYDSADLIVNLHGGTVPRDEFARQGRLVYVETDPVQLQVELHDGLADTEAFLEPHVAFFTFGENIGRPDCGVPAPTDRIFVPTRQPVVTSLWRDRDGGPGRAFTTIGNWRQEWRDVQLRGQRYGWSKHEEWEHLLPLARRVAAPFELALASVSGSEVERLRSLGWMVVPAGHVSSGIDAYRRYITSSKGEITVAKDQNVRLRTGWFSDRSATYLAAGRPVVTQDTGFGSVLPTGEGLFAFRDIDGAAAGLDEVLSDPRRHARAAADIAREHFEATTVLGAVLEHCGVRPTSASIPRRRPDAFPPLLDLTVVSRHPTELPTATTDHVLGMATTAPACSEIDTRSEGVGTSLVVVTHDHLAVTRLCLDTLLVNTDTRDVEIVVVDSGSQHDTLEHLRSLADVHAEVRLIELGHNAGFATAVNVGLAAARGDALGILNNDLVLTPGWLDGLLAHLENPAVGMVGPVSPGAPNEARVEQDFRTYDELCAVAERRARVHAGRTRELPMLAMFCVLLRREVWAAVGPLDERFGIGLFEDDDYALRVRAAGWSLHCADDVLVHHLGQVSFGDLVSDGRHARLFDENRRRFEEKWAMTWQPHARPVDPAYDAMVSGLQQMVAATVGSSNDTVLVVSKGDDRLLQLHGATAQHFPQGSDGSFAGHHPGSVDEIARELDALTTQGAGWLVLPATSRWWLDHYDGLDRLLEQHYEIAGEGEHGTVFRRREMVRAEA